MTDSLSRLRAGLDRDEAIARAALDPTRMPEALQHAGRHDPSRVLRQSEVLREIVARTEDNPVTNRDDFDAGYAVALAEVAELLASIYTEDTEAGS